MKEYQTARASYAALLKTVYDEPDPTKRNVSIAQVKVQNETLVNIAQSLLSQWDALNRTPITNQSLSELRDDLVRYQQDLETMKGLKDESTRLNMMYANITGDVSANRTMYYFYIVAVFVLLLLVFVLFALRTVLGGVVSTVETAVDTVLEQPSGRTGV
jgi:cell shape-determining protein MreC